MSKGPEGICSECVCVCVCVWENVALKYFSSLIQRIGMHDSALSCWAGNELISVPDQFEKYVDYVLF